MGYFRPHLPRLIQFAALFLVGSFGASAAHAGPAYMFLVVDPATTAGAGVPDSDGFSVTSNRSGAGSWHLYAVDNLSDSYGIRSFFVKLNGDITSLSNRSPMADYDDGSSLGVGFNQIRATTPTIDGSQGVYNDTQIGGFGISAGNFQLSTPGQSFSATTSGQWGNYADPFTSGYLGNTGEHRNALFLAEGTYSGIAPTVDVTTSFADGGTGVVYWTDAGLTRSDTALQLSSSNPFACPDCVAGNDPHLVSWTGTRATGVPAAPDPLPPPPGPHSYTLDPPVFHSDPTKTVNPPPSPPLAPPVANENPREGEPPIQTGPIVDNPWVINFNPDFGVGNLGEFLYFDESAYYIQDSLIDVSTFFGLSFGEYAYPSGLPPAMVTNLAGLISYSDDIDGGYPVDSVRRESFLTFNAVGVDHDGVFDSLAMGDAISAPEPHGVFLAIAAQASLSILARRRPANQKRLNAR